MLRRSLGVRNIVVAVVAVGLGFATAVGALAFATDSSAKAKPKVKTTVIRVTAGKPSEFGFKLSKVQLIKAGFVEFKVTNRGKIPHTFKICTRKAKTDKANKCAGKVTKLLKTGATATVKIKLGKGTYEFLCTVAGHAAAGMKGMVGIGVKLKKTLPTPTTPEPTTPEPTTPTPTTPTPTTPAPTTGTEPLLGDPVAGKQVFLSNPCGSCHTLAAAGTNGNVGPNLDLAKPTQALVKFYVTNGSNAGGATMPAFSLSATDLNNLAAFVYQATHS